VLIARCADAAMAILFAPVCASCEDPLDAPSSGAVCDACWGAIRPLADPLCDTCGDALLSWRAGMPCMCLRCLRTPRVITRARAIAAYDGSLRDILQALKYNGRRSVARRLGQLMAAAGTLLLGDADVVVPVPLHFTRRYSRGFNQAADLASHVGLPVLHALRRRRVTATQTELPEHERHRNVDDAFTVRWGASARLRDSVVVVVDDVSTTGATLDACARVLLEAGAREVRALTAARAASRLQR